jgi:hypothetical protein
MDDDEDENDFSMYELNHEVENKTQLHDDGGSGGSKMFGDDQVDVANGFMATQDESPAKIKENNSSADVGAFGAFAYGALNN